MPVDNTSDQDKLRVLNKFFSAHYQDFTSKAKSIHKTSALGFDESFHHDLIHELYLEMICTQRKDKNGKTRLERNYVLLQKNELYNYFSRAIWMGCYSPKTNFFGQELRHKQRHKQVDWTEQSEYTSSSTDTGVDLNYLLSSTDAEQAELEQMMKEDGAIDMIRDIVAQPDIIAWHEAQVFMEYVSSNLTIAQLATSYQMSSTMLFSMVDRTRKKIIKILKASGQYGQVTGRKGR